MTSYWQKTARRKETSFVEVIVLIDLETER